MELPQALVDIRTALNAKCPFGIECESRNGANSFREAFEDAPVGIGLISIDGKFIHANKFYCKLLGRTVEELQTLNFQAVTHPDDIASDVALAQKCLSGEIDRYELEKRYIKKDGTVIWVSLYGALVRRENKPYYFVAHVIDISEQKKLLESLQRQKGKLKLAAKASRQGWWDWDILNGKVDCSPEMLTLMGYDPDHDTVPANFSEWLNNWHDEDKKRVIDALGKHLNEHEPYDVKYRVKMKDGEFRWFQTVGQAEWDKSGNPICMSGFFRDIQHEKEQEKSLYVAMQEAHRKNEELEQFAYIASHDLQEPLRTVSSYVQLFAMKYKDQVDDKGKQYIDYIVNSTSRMRDLIRDLLEYSRSGNISEKSNTSFHKVMDDILLNMSSKISASKAKIIYDEWTDTPIYANHNDICRLFQNLISNSIKFHKPNMRPTVKIAYSSGPEGFTEFSVKDNGVGISKEHHDKLFKMFYRVQKQESSVAGNGIGLAICKRLVEKHGGNIWLESKEGKGAKFSFTLPNKPSKEKHEDSNS